MLTNILNRKRQATQQVDVDALLESRGRSERVAIQNMCVSAVEDRVADVTLELRAQITEELRMQFHEELEVRVASIRDQYAQFSDVSKATGFDWVSPELIEEIAATQADLVRKEKELAGHLANDSAALGAISRLRSEIRETASYLKGLNFCGKAALESK